MIQEDKSATLATANQQTLFQPVAYGIDHVITTGGNCTAQGPCVYEDVCPTQKAAGAHSVAYGIENHPQDSRVRLERDGKIQTLSGKMGTGDGNTPMVLEKVVRWIVRRLTPLECERLQGFPDGWTDIGEWRDSKGKKRISSDGARYKALGNSIALPQWFWLAQKMKPYLPENAKLGSLFDGIGGFPLIWEDAYGKGTARWASEIEEFPIAVTKFHFREPEDDLEAFLVDIL